MDDGLSHLPEKLRTAMKRRPRRAHRLPPSPRGRGQNSVADGILGEGESPAGEGETLSPQNNYLAEAPKNPIGARPGNRNALKHGRFTAEARARRAALTARIRDMRRRVAAAIAQVEETLRRREQPDG